MIKYNIYHKGNRLNRSALTEDDVKKLKEAGSVRVKKGFESTSQTYRFSDCKVVQCIVL